MDADGSEWAPTGNLILILFLVPFRNNVDW